MSYKAKRMLFVICCVSAGALLTWTLLPEKTWWQQVPLWKVAAIGGGFALVVLAIAEAIFKEQQPPQD